MLVGLAAVAIPIIIHLLNRSRPRSIEWGAMQFLVSSIAARSRRIKVEDAVLLCLRCLVAAFIVLAMARPFLPGGAAVPWIFILPGVVIAVLCAGISAVVWSNRRLRRRLLWAAAVLLVVAVPASVLERRIQARRWMTAGSGDIAVVLDASMSMTATVDGRSNFSRAVEEARALVGAMRPGDACAVVLGGPVPRPLVRRPTSDRRELERVLESPECRPAGGVMAAIEALNMAAGLLAEGSGAAKTIVVFTDGHAAGWDLAEESRWQFLASGFKSLPSAPRVVYRRFPQPESFRNAAISDIRLSRGVVGSDRAVKIDVTVLNAGRTTIQPAAVDLLVDGKREGRVSLGRDMTPLSSETLHFNHRFETPGYHVVTAVVTAEDDIAADNSMDRAVNVLDRLPVLLVEGSTAERTFFRQTASLVRSALMPRDDPVGNAVPAPGDPSLVNPTIVKAPDIAAIANLSRYSVVILADVPRLPAAVADRLGDFVKAGGGLLIAAGGRAEPDFYNAWQTTAGENVAPAVLKERVYPGDPRRFELESFTHPALRLVAQPDQSDARFCLVSAYWKMEAGEPSAQVGAGGLLDSKDPWLVERRLGRGRVLMTPMAFDRRDSNLPSLKAFVPLVHEMVYYLALTSMAETGIKPGSEWVFSGSIPSGSTQAGSGSVTVVLPSGEIRPAVMAQQQNSGFVVRFRDTGETGLYRARLPAALAAAAGIAPEALFTVDNQPVESTLDMLGDADIESIRGHVDLHVIESLDELLMSLQGKVPGQELWKIFVLCALLTLVAEIALTRWIVAQRRLHQSDSVVLHSPAENVQAMKDRLARLLETSQHG